jgi:hypothetical protein
LPPHISRSAEYARILELERKLGSRPEFAAVARYTQCLARPIPTSAKPSRDEDRSESIA